MADASIKLRGGRRIDGFAVLVWLPALFVTCVFAAIVMKIAVVSELAIDLEYLTSSPSHGGRAGGILPIVVSTMAIVAIALCTAVPIAIGAALALSEFGRPDGGAAKTVRMSLDVLASVPSIVFGLFGNALFCRFFGMGYSILAGGLTLACMILPLLIRGIEQSCRSVSRDYRLGATALGLSRSSLALHVVLPAAAPGIVVCVLLAIARALSETAALVFTSGYVDRMPRSVLDSGRSLSIHILDLATNVAGGDQRAAAATMVLIGLLFLINGGVLCWSNAYGK